MSPVDSRPTPLAGLIADVCSDEIDEAYHAVRNDDLMALDWLVEEANARTDVLNDMDMTEKRQVLMYVVDNYGSLQAQQESATGPFDLVRSI